MEKNGLEVSEIEPHSVWIYLPNEIWYQIFGWLKATRYIALLGATTKGFRNFMVEYFQATSHWMGKNMNVAIIGSPAVGKTTMLAHMLLQSRQQNIDNKFLHYIRTNPTRAVTEQYNTFLNGFYSPHLEHTQHIHPFYLKNTLHNFTFFDTPGCSRRLISAYRICTQMNTAILMFQKQNTLDCDWLVNGVTALLTSLTHSHFIIAINYNRTVFKRADWEADQKLVLEKLVKAVPPKLVRNIKLIPINALVGFNIYSPHAGVDDTNLWYTGPTLFRALHAIWEKLEYPEERLQLPFSMTVVRTYNIRGYGPVLAGVVNSGCVKPDMKVRLACSGFPAKQQLTINTIQHARVNIDEAKSSDYIGVSFTSASITNLKASNFDVLARAKYGITLTDANNAPKRVKSFVAAIAVTSKTAGLMNEGRQYKAIYQGAHIFVVLEKFIQVLDKQHNDVARKSISQGDSCLALCVPTQEMWAYPKVNTTQQERTENGLRKRSTSNKKESSEVILFTSQRRIHAVGRIDTVTFFSADEIQNLPSQLAHLHQPRK